ncbi:hypothetical protein [Eoetvoesiella caeni]
MASYKDAVHWIADEEAPADTPEGMDFAEAVAVLDGNVTVVMVGDLWGKSSYQVAIDVIKVRGFRMPRGFQRND